MLGSLKIGFLPMRHLLPNTVRKFCKSYPAIDVSVHQYHNYELLNDALKHGTVDVAFNISCELLFAPLLIRKKLSSVPLALVVRNDHEFASTGAIDWPSLTGKSFVTLERRLAPFIFDFTMQLCSTRGLFPKFVREANSVDAVLVSVESEMGLTILPRYFELYGHPGLCFITIGGPDAQLNIELAWNKENSNPSLPLFTQEFFSDTD